RGVVQTCAAHSFEVVDGHRARAIRPDHQIDTADRDVAGGDDPSRPARQDLLADRLRRHRTAWVAGEPASARATMTVPPRLLNVLTVDRHMSSGRSMPATSAMPAAAFGPSPIALSTISVVTSELPGTPAPADDATTVVSTIVRIVPIVSGSP